MGLVSGLVKAVSRIAQPQPLERQNIDQLVSISRASWAQENLGTGFSTTVSDAELRRQFHGWQYACATALAEAVMQLGYEVQISRGGQWEAVEEHPLLDLLHRVSAVLTGEELWYYTMLDLLIVGKCWWYLPPNGLGDPGEIWPLTGDLKPVFDGSKALTGWKQALWSEGKLQSREYTVEEIVYLRFPKPGDLMGGIGPAQAAGPALRLDWAITESEWSAMRQGLWPSVLLKIPGRTPQERQQILDEFRDRYSGISKGGGVIGTGEGVQVEWPPLKPREMGFERGADRMRDMICAMYRVPRAILGLSEGLPRANVEGMHYVFAQWSVRPKVKLLESRINQDLIARRYGEDVRLEFENPVPVDAEARARRDEMELRNYVTTVNEYRADRLNLPAVPWGAVPIAPFGVAPLGTAPDAPGDAQSIDGVDTHLAGPNRRGGAFTAPTAEAIAEALLRKL